MFGNNSGGSGGGNLFGNSGGTAGSIFGKTQQQAGTGTGIFGQGTQNTQSSQGQGNLFGNKGAMGTGTGTSTGGSGSLFGNQGATGGGGSTLFGNNQQSSSGGNLVGGGGGNLFGGTQSSGGSGGNLFGQTTQGGNLFGGGGGTQMGSYGGYGQQITNLANISEVNEQQIIYLMTQPQDQHKKIFETFQIDYIKKLLAHYRKSIDPSKLDKLNVSAENPLKNQKLSKVAGSMNIKKELVQLKRNMKENMVSKVKKLKDERTKVEDISQDLSKKVFDKLQKYKEKLVLTVAQTKMIDEIKKEIDDIDQQIKEFFKPLFNSYQNRVNHSFIDPDPFCLKVAESCLKNMTYLDNKMDELLSCNTEPTQEGLETADVIKQLVEYYENVAMSVKEFGEKFNLFKRKIAHKSQTNPEDLLRKISDKANSSMKKGLECYDTVKQIETLINKRERYEDRIPRK